MKIAISVKEKKGDTEIDPFFGRCKYFAIVDTEDEQINFIDNTAFDQPTGAGIAAAKLVAENKADKIITGSLGPKAIDVMKQFNIPAYKSEGKLKQAIAALSDNKLERIC